MINWKQAAKFFRRERARVRGFNAGLAQESHEAQQEVARLHAALAYLEGRVKDYPILHVLLQQAKDAVPNR